MKHLFSFITIFLFGIVSTSCQNQPNSGNSVTFYQDSNALYSAIGNTNTTTIPNKVEFKTIMDPQKNMPVCFMPLPSDWKINKTINNNDNVFMTGPKNIKVYGDFAFNFFYSSDPYVNQSMQQKGFVVAPVKSVTDIIKDNIEPHAKSEGGQLVKTYKVPELISFDQNYDQYTFKSFPPNSRTFDVVATEWTDNKGTSSLAVIHYGVALDQYQQANWYYYINSMSCDQSTFESAKQAYLYALQNTKYNPNWLRYNYMKDAEAARKSGEIHESRMTQLRAEAEAIVQRGKEQSLTVDRNHEKFMNAHLERTTVSTSSGQSYKVDAGSNYYWMNSDGQYISSDNPNFNPNSDPNYNKTDWKSTTIENN